MCPHLYIIHHLLSYDYDCLLERVGQEKVLVLSHKPRKNYSKTPLPIHIPTTVYVYSQVFSFSHVGSLNATFGGFTIISTALVGFTETCTGRKNLTDTFLIPLAGPFLPVPTDPFLTSCVDPFLSASTDSLLTAMAMGGTSGLDGISSFRNPFVTSTSLCWFLDRWRAAWSRRRRIQM